MFAILSFIVLLSFLVIIHELGHFLAAKWAGIGVEEFGLGYPPRLMRLFRRWQVEFSLNWIPFGGFVRLQGEDASPDSSPQSGDYRASPLARRLVVILAGAGVNFIFGVLVFAIIFTRLGIPTEINSARIGMVEPSSPAATAQLESGWEITEIKVDDQSFKTETPADVIEVVQAHRGETVQLRLIGPCQQLTCQSKTKTATVYVRKPEETPPGVGAIGVVFEPIAYVHYPIWQLPFRGAWVGLKQALALSGLILQALKSMLIQLFTQHQLLTDLAGPVGIVHQAETSGLFSQGWLAILSFTAMLSVNLAIMNVLPVPPLDGGRAVLAVSELILGKRKTAKIEHYLNYGGWILMMSLILAITARDIWRIVQ